MWLLLIVAFAAFLVWVFMASVVSLLMPPERVGRSILTRELKERGIAVRSIPDPFLADCIADAVRASDGAAGGVRARRRAFTENLQRRADLFCQWLKDPSSSALDGAASDTALFARHFDTSR